MRPVSILDILTETEQWLDLHKLFGPLSGFEAKIDDPRKRFITTLFCYGCNLGPSQTATRTTSSRCRNSGVPASACRPMARSGTSTSRICCPNITSGTVAMAASATTTCRTSTSRCSATSSRAACTKPSTSSMVTPLAQDHKIVRIGHDATAKTALKSKLLPCQHKPAHIHICQ